METVGVIGGGQMGSQIAALAAMAGYETHVYDSDADNLKSKIKFTEDNLVNLIDKGRYEKYWTPLIGVFTGCRLGEITQLHLDDIKKYGSHRNKRWVFDINENTPDKHLKNLPSTRLSLIHI